MKTSIKIIGIFFVIFVLFSLFVSWYLGPDDIGHCGARPTDRDECGSVDAIVAVSGGDTSARADEAIRLYKDGWAPQIIFSGAAADKSGPSNASVMKQQAIEAGIRPSDILTEETSENTAQNASETTSIFVQKNIKSAILVTSPYHERRALLEFRKRAGNVIFRARPAPHDTHWSALWWITPQGWAVAMPEFVRSLILSMGGVDQR